MQAVDICNMALSEMGARVKITNLTTDTSPAAVHCNIWYDRLRRQLLRRAPWGFARFTVALTPTGSILNAPPDNQYPFMFNYQYPADCLKMRYLVPSPPPVPGVTPPIPGQPLLWYPWMMPDRRWRYVVSNVSGKKYVLANLNQAIGIYNGDVTDPTLFDEQFIGALASQLAEKLIMPLAGNIQLKSGLMGVAEKAVSEARVSDGNEAMPSTDHVPDWLQARGLAGPFDGYPTLGVYNATWGDGGYGD